MERSLYVICIDRNLEDCELLKVYRVIPDAQSESRGMLRILDESGEDYLYPATSFLHLSLEDRQADALDAILPAAS
jgi:hypothetical protein